jgi:Ser/Thr protein kinase RdoA (MazF antagonist)
MDVASGDLPELQESELGPRAGPDDALLDEAAATFGLGAIQAARDLGGTYNLNLRLYTAGGSFVLRVHRPWVTAERVAVLQVAKQRLAAAGFPVSVPLATTEGEPALRWGNRMVEVEPFVAHDNVTDSWDRYPPAFAVLARLHDGLTAAIDPETFVPPRVSNYGSPTSLLGWVGQTEARIRANPPGNATGRALQVCATANDVLGKLADWWPRAAPGLPVQPIHGDYGGGNVLFRRGRVVAVVDFDFLAMRERVYDLAYCLYWMLVRLAGTELPADLPWEATRGMLDAYDAAAQHRLSRIERQAIPYEIARVPLYWVGEAQFLPDPALTVARLADSVKFARWTFAHGGDLARLFSLR